MEFPLLVVLVFSIAQVRASCPMTFVHSLVLDKFMGTWYQYASYGKFFVHGLDRCVKSDYTLGADRKTITILNDRIAKGVSTHVTSTWVATAKCPPDGELSLKVNVPVLGDVTIPLMVLGTDYHSYAVLYTSKYFGPLHYYAGWIFTKKRTHSDKELAPILCAVDEILKKNNLQRSDFGVTNQEDCD